MHNNRIRINSDWEFRCAPLPASFAERLFVKINKEIFMFNELKEINSRPEPYQLYTANALSTDEHTSQKMLE
jgi:hypothetical protein